MFNSKRRPEEFKLEKGIKLKRVVKGFRIKQPELDFVNADYIALSILRNISNLTEKTHPLVQIVLDNAKGDEKFFEALVGFFERYDRREFILQILRIKLLKYCMENFSET